MFYHLKTIAMHTNLILSFYTHAVTLVVLSTILTVTLQASLPL